MTNTIPHAQWETLQTEAEDYAEHIKGLVEATLARMDVGERRIYCNHLFQMAEKETTAPNVGANPKLLFNPPKADAGSIPRSLLRIFQLIPRQLAAG
jgi:hypothetical protein